MARGRALRRCTRSRAAGCARDASTRAPATAATLAASMTSTPARRRRLPEMASARSATGRCARGGEGQGVRTTLVPNEIALYRTPRVLKDRPLFCEGSVDRKHAPGVTRGGLCVTMASRLVQIFLCTKPPPAKPCLYSCPPVAPRERYVAPRLG